MNKEQLLQMTSKEIEEFLNDNILDVTFESENDVEVKLKMIDKVIPLFDDSIKPYAPYYTNKELSIRISSISINFKVSTKKTGKTKQVSRLKRKDIKKIGKFKFDDILIGFSNPDFEAEDLDNYVVKLSDYWCSGGAEISLKHREEKIIDMLSKDILLEETQKQNENWSDVRKTMILSAAQPRMKRDFFRPNWTEESMGIILKKTEEVNKDLIDSTIEKMFDIL